MVGTAKKPLSPEASRQRQTCFCLTKPDAGSNTIRTSPWRKARNRFALNGQRPSSRRRRSDYALVVSGPRRIRGSEEDDGFTLFIVDLGQGVQKTIFRSAFRPESSAVFFDDVDLGPEDVIGEVRQGLRFCSRASTGRILWDRSAAASVATRSTRRRIRQRAQGLQQRSDRAYQGCSIRSPAANRRRNGVADDPEAAWVFDQGREAGEFATCEARPADAAPRPWTSRCNASAQRLHQGVWYLRLLSAGALLKTAPQREMILNYIASTDGCR